MTVRNIKLLVAMAAAFIASLIVPVHAMAHCDSLDGPVIHDARLALEKNDPAPALRWVDKKQEGEILSAFKQTVAFRSKGDEAKAFADRYFFETLVRLHRQSEGEPYTGLKPAGSVDPGIAAADKALQTGEIKELKTHVSSAVSKELQRRFDTVLELRKHAGDSVEAGRKYVAAYVDYTHFVENIHRLVSHRASHADKASSPHAGH